MKILRAPFLTVKRFFTLSTLIDLLNLNFKRQNKKGLNKKKEARIKTVVPKSRLCCLTSFLTGRWLKYGHKSYQSPYLESLKNHKNVAN